MGKISRKKARVSLEPQVPEFCPFAEQLRELGEDLSVLPPGGEAVSPGPEDLSRKNVGLKGTFSLRLEKKGRGGKKVTLLQGSHLGASEAEALAKRMRKALGCGARTEGRSVVLQGDLRERAREWLKKEGVTSVSLG